MSCGVCASWVVGMSALGVGMVVGTITNACEGLCNRARAGPMAPGHGEGVLPRTRVVFRPILDLLVVVFFVFHSAYGYGYGYMVGALPRGRCARSMAGFVGLPAEADSPTHHGPVYMVSPRVPLQGVVCGVCAP